MKTAGIVIVGALAAVGCGASYPPPAQHLADAQSSLRAAQEMGAQTQPQAQLYMRLAQEELDRARAYIQRGDNERADYALVRARADGDLALAIARETAARNDADKAVKQANAMQANPNNSGTIDPGVRE